MKRWIKKILNNNAVIAAGSDQQEVVITGLGLAFKKKVGDLLDDSKIERIFKMQSKEISQKLHDLISEIPVEYVGISEEIVQLFYAKTQKTLNENIYLTLTDHIHFAVERLDKGYALTNPMAWEIKRFYEQEYAVGVSALDIIYAHLGLRFPEYEAASNAMHLVNAALNEEMPNIVILLKILQDALNIIKYHYGFEFDESTIYYQRLVTHLKFFAQRIVNKEREHSTDESLFEIVSRQYPEAHECALKIKKYAYEKHQFEVSKSELTYLIVHIEKVIERKKND